AYIAQLQSEQVAFFNRLQTALPSATVAQFVDETGTRQNLTYQVVFNGMAINPGANVSAAGRDATRKLISTLPGVKAVYQDMPHYQDLYTSTALINAPAVWTALGGRANAGAGVKFASMDGGVYGGLVDPAPMFSGATYTYPNGFGPNGKGLTNNNNGKVITSRAYFRSWDPPQTADPGLRGCGDACAWPGPEGTSHGVHTASTAAGNIVTDVVYNGYNVGTMSGVAPRAYVMSYKVFYGSVNSISSFYTAEGIAALEDIAIDGADVLNNSWGSGPYSTANAGDPLEVALANTASTGVFISMSAGNSGPSNSTLDHPLRDYINVAASTSGGTLADGYASVPGAPDLAQMPYGTAEFGALIDVGEVITNTYLPSAVVDAANVRGCNAFPAGAFAGKAALIQRGTCNFSTKVRNAQTAGATLVAIYNNTGGTTIQGMSCGDPSCADLTVPAIFVSQNNGAALLNWYNTQGAVASVLVVSGNAFQLGDEPDVIANFSSRGPGVGLALLPDIAAPGVNILAQGYTPGATGEEQYLGYGQASGTSMAAPHVAGAAILVRQAYPFWSNAQIKSALMSTSKYTDVYDYDGTPAQPLDMGAGRLDLTNVLNPGVLLDPPSVSFGAVPSGTVQTITVQVTGVATQTETYTATTLYTGDSFTATTALPGFSVTPAVFSLAFGQTRVISVTFTSNDSQGIGENQGYIVLDGSAHHAHMPVWARVTPAAQVADVLLIDNDASDLDPSFGDYLDVYTSTLDALGVTYDVVNTADSFGDPTTIPDAAHLAGYGAVVWYTGDNYVAAAGLTNQDQYNLLDYLTNGGTVIAMGQDLASTVGAAPGSQYNGLYNFGLGSTWVQDSISANEIPTGYATRAPSAPRLFSNVVVSLTQLYVDEIKPDINDNPYVLRGGVPVLNYGGPFNILNGTVAMLHRDQAVLEGPVIPYLGKAFYTTFGLEGIGDVATNVLTTTTGVELLGSALAWAGSEPGTGTISDITPITSTAITIFSAGYTATVPAGYDEDLANPVSYRWDFGDGSGFVATPVREAGHTYVCQANGSNTYTVRVEIIDGFGNGTVVSKDVDVSKSCNTAPVTILKYFIPWVGKDFKE
ncbi:MAG: S8 family serine peptidase, partial [Caldilineaceae bacterium]